MGVLTVIHDADCAFCIASARWLQQHDSRLRLRFTPIADVVDVGGVRLRRADLEREMHVVDRRGRVHRGFRAWRRIARDVPTLRPLLPLLWLPGASLIGELAYRWVAAHRTTLSQRLLP